MPLNDIMDKLRWRSMGYECNRIDVLKMDLSKIDKIHELGQISAKQAECDSIIDMIEKGTGE